MKEQLEKMEAKLDQMERKIDKIIKIIDIWVKHQCNKGKFRTQSEMNAYSTMDLIIS